MRVSISAHIQTSQGLGSSLFMAYELLMRFRNVKSIILTAFWRKRDPSIHSPPSRRSWGFVTRSYPPRLRAWRAKRTSAQETTQYIAIYCLTECLSHNTNQQKLQIRNKNHSHCQVYWQPQLTASHPATWQVAHALSSALQLQIRTQILQCWIQPLRLLHQPKKKFQSNITSLMCSPYNWGGHWRLLLV